MAAALLPAPGAHAASKIRYVTIKGVRYVLAKDVAAYYGMAIGADSNQAVLQSRFSKLTFTVNKREATVNKVKVHLSLAPTLWQKQVVLSETDFTRLIDPVMRSQALPRATPRRIMLDPGHGGKDRGTIGKWQKYREKDFTLAVARQVRNLLRQRGYTVGMTRDSDKTVSLTERAALAKRWKADAFVSIHANYVSTASVSGAEVFVLTPKNTPSTYGNTRSKAASPGNAFDQRSALLGYDVQKALVTGTKCVDRGLKRARFVVLRDAPCPAALIEAGFMSNRLEESRLRSAAYQAKIAAGIANGILQYCRQLAPKKN